MRTNNEDLPLCDPGRGVYAVIDGVGGGAAGEVAAAIAMDVINKRLQRPLGTPAERVREAIALANNEIFKEADQSLTRHGMTCVLTLALVTEGGLTVGHVGDSRLYKLFPGGIRKLTHDHSPIGEREDAEEISEVEAMRHPRRHEVFRDVGRDHRDKDDEGFVEIIEDTLENDCALLLCTDGLSDMVPSSIIEHLIKRHAGDPQAVVDALVAAANDAGGRDNITVVYAEAPEFRRAVRDDGGLTVSAPIADWHADRCSSVTIATEPMSATPVKDTSTVRRGESAADTFRARVLTGRTTWFAGGTVAGVVASLVLVGQLSTATADHGRTLVVGGSGPHVFGRIADATASARPGDIVQLEPGTYKEEVVVPDGVDFVARLAGKVVLSRGEGASGGWTALRAAGASGGRIYGIRIESTLEAPLLFGMRISGQGRRIELVDVDGPMTAGIVLTEATAVTIRGSLFHTAQGPAVSLDTGSEATIMNNTFIRGGAPSEPAVSVTDASGSVVTRNVFLGYGAEFVRGLPTGRRLQLLSGNFVAASEPTLVR